MMSMAEVKAVLTSVVAFLVLTAGSAAAMRPGEADWPMLAHDVTRSGATGDEVKPPVRRAWLRYFHMEGIMPSVQPVVVRDRVYFGTLGGNFYCLDARTGRDVWRRDVGSPVFHTACVSPEGLVVFGCGDGTVRALKVADGAPAWQYRTGAPLWNSPLPHEERIYIGGRDGNLYCLNAADGGLIWKFEAGAPICQSPALDPKRGAVYFTSEAMYVHALDVRTGREKWKSEQVYGVTARSFHPVIAPDGTVMTNTIPLYSWPRCRRPLERVKAELLGTEELPQHKRRRAGTYTKIPAWFHDEETSRRFDRHVREVFLKPDYFGRQAAALLREIEADPASQCLFLLDPDTGKKRATAPVLYCAFAKSAFTPPLVAPGGKVITKWCALLPSRYRGYQQFASIAYIDPATGKVEPVFDESRVGSGSELNLIGDESCQMSIGGRYLLNLAHHHGENLHYFDLSDERRGTLGRYYTTHLHAYGVGVIHCLLRDEVDKIPFSREDMPPWVAANGDIGSGNHLSANMPVVIAGGRIFWMCANKLMVLEPSDRPPVFGKSRNRADYGIQPLTDDELKTFCDTWPIEWDMVNLKNWGDRKVDMPDRTTYVKGTRQNPDHEAAKKADAIGDSTLDRYIWETPVPGRAPGDPQVRDLNKKLAAAVEELVSKPLWMPYRFQGGKHPSDALQFYGDPSDTVYALALAYPFLAPDLQSKAKAYVRRQWARKNPVMLTRYKYGEGEPREPYIVPEGGVEARILGPVVRERGVERAYVAWLWAENTGEWDLLRPLWASLKNAHRWTQFKTEKDAMNAYCSGLIAACRMAKKFGDAEALKLNLAAARTRLRERVAFELRYHKGNVAHGRQKLNMGLWRGFSRWKYLTPELGRMMRERCGDVSLPLLKLHSDTLRPFWYLNWGPLTPSGKESSTQLPDNTVPPFLAKAYLEEAPPERLAIYADVKACKADLYWIQKLAITLAAYSKPRWRKVE